MRIEDKQLEGPELLRSTQQRENQLEEQEREQLPEIANEEVRDAAFERRGELLAAMRTILGGDQLSVSRLRLPLREQQALESLQAAVNGRESTMGLFVFASDRRDLLEQALAVLQPNITRGDERVISELASTFSTLTDRLGELRAGLKDLEDAQDELLDGRDRSGRAHGKADNAADGADPPPPDVDPDAPRPASTLSEGPELLETRPPSSLVGDAPPEAKARPTTLGDDAEIATAQAKKPWWRRPFG